MTTKLLITCNTCGIEFYRGRAEVNRSRRIGRKLYCSRICSGKQHTSHLRKGMWHDKLVRKPDEHSPFRIHFICAKRRARDLEIPLSITLEDLKNVWDTQRGICPYTGWELDNPPTSGSKRVKSPKRASLDRKDSSKGYTLNNIQFVSQMANFAKNAFHEDELIAFCKLVANNYACQKN